MIQRIEKIHNRPKFQNFKFQLTERGYNNIDAIDGSEGMLGKAKEKGVYKNCITAILGPASIQGIKRGQWPVLSLFGNICLVTVC